MRRLALLSDIHGNLEALAAVLEDISASGAPVTYCLGDLVGYGPEPARVIDSVRDRHIPTVRGNYDDGIGNRRGDCGCYYAGEQVRRDGEASLAFTTSAVDDARAGWLASLPDELRLEIEGLRVLLAHGSPRKINEYLQPDRSDALLGKLASDAGADVICVGHVHVPYHRIVPIENGAVHYVNAGSVGRPKDGDWRACWVELLVGTSDEVRGATDDPHAGAAGKTDTWVGTTAHRVSYDIESVQRDMLRAGLPATLAAALRSA